MLLHDVDKMESVGQIGRTKTHIFKYTLNGNRRYCFWYIWTASPSDPVQPMHIRWAAGYPLSAQCKGVVCALCSTVVFKVHPFTAWKACAFAIMIIIPCGKVLSLDRNTVNVYTNVIRVHTDIYVYIFECKMMRVTFAHMLAGWNRSAAAATTAMKTLPKRLVCLGAPDPKP